MQTDHERIYAIGDVHGRADLLKALLASIVSDAADANVEPTIIFLGDIIDRGQDSLQALQLVERALETYPKSKLILGNHDDCLLSVLNGTYTNKGILKWLHLFGGLATVSSLLPRFSGDEDDVAEALASRYPNFRRMLEQAARYVVIGNYCFVHAGVRPGVPLVDQTNYDLMWIREEFIQHAGSFGKIIVHGHTPTDTNLPEIHRNRIAIDTKAYETGSLTALVLQDENASVFLKTTTLDSSLVTVEELSGVLLG